jgi:hypothetical protein
MSWSAEQLQQIDSSRELQIATVRNDGTLHTWVSIWVVRVGDDVYVRTWYRRDTGWFGRAVSQRRARIRVPALETEVAIEDMGDSTAELQSKVNAAYRTKYGLVGHRSMVTDDAVATTLRLCLK